MARRSCAIKNWVSIKSAILIMKPILVFPAPKALETPKSFF
jgi:hypothetical protein